MAPATELLSVDEYHAQYAGKNGYEYWFGRAVKKPVPTWMHAVLQYVLCDLLYKAGYFSASELDLRVDPDWEPRPDVTGALEIDGPYPTKPVEVAIEILSDDQMPRLLEKCGHYSRIGIPQVFVFDPKERLIWEWNRDRHGLDRVEDLNLRNGSVISGATIWNEFSRRISRRADQASGVD